ncbi:MAG: transketolase family protein [Sphaerimonospora mesophila]|jgi:transketolase
MSYSLADDIFSGNTRSDSTRAGFGRGLVQAGENNVNVVALTADLAESVQFHHFAERFPERFIEVGIAEQNLVTVASGMAHVGKIPFTGSYAAFSPGRNWEQIRTTIALNNQPVKIVGSHAGLNVGPDGATHQVLEDIALMRTLPNMIVIAPGDAVEAEKVARAVANDSRPTYIRLAREKSPIFSTDDSPFEIGPAYVLREGSDISLLSTGTMTAQVLLAADQLARQGVLAEVVHVPTIKPLDEETILKSVRKTGNAVTIEEHQIAGGFGSAIAELLGDQLPTKMKRIGVNDQFGQSGTAAELLDYYGLTADKMVQTITEFLSQSR